MTQTYFLHIQAVWLHLHTFTSWVTISHLSLWLIKIQRKRTLLFLFVAENLSFRALKLRMNVLLWINTSGALKAHMPRCVLWPCSLAHSLCSHLWVGKSLTDGQCSSVYRPGKWWLISKGEVSSVSFSWNLEMGLGPLFLTRGVLSPVQWECYTWIAAWWKHICHQWVIQYVGEFSTLMTEIVLGVSESRA